MDPSRFLAILGIAGATLTGSGGIGYAFVQWLLKRNDPEARANAARVLTDAAAGIIAELQKEKMELKDEIRMIKEEIQVFKISVDYFIDAVEEVLPLLESSQIDNLRNTMREVKGRL